MQMRYWENSENNYNFYKPRPFQNAVNEQLGRVSMHRFAEFVSYNGFRQYDKIYVTQAENRNTRMIFSSTRTNMAGLIQNIIHYENKYNTQTNFEYDRELSSDLIISTNHKLHLEIFLLSLFNSVRNVDELLPEINYMLGLKLIKDNQAFIESIKNLMKRGYFEEAFQRTTLACNYDITTEIANYCIEKKFYKHALKYLAETGAPEKIVMTSNVKQMMIEEKSYFWEDEIVPVPDRDKINLKDFDIDTAFNKLAGLDDKTELKGVQYRHSFLNKSAELINQLYQEHKSAETHYHDLKKILNSNKDIKTLHSTRLYNDKIIGRLSERASNINTPNSTPEVHNKFKLSIKNESKQDILLNSFWTKGKELDELFYKAAGFNQGEEIIEDLDNENFWIDVANKIFQLKQKSQAIQKSIDKLITANAETFNAVNQIKQQEKTISTLKTHINNFENAQAYKQFVSQGFKI